MIPPKVLSHALLAAVVLLPGAALSQKESPRLRAGWVERVEAQPLLAQAARVRQALDYLGSPVSPGVAAALDRAAREPDDTRATAAIQDALDPLCLAVLHVGKDDALSAIAGPARPALVEQGWRVFLVKVVNEVGAATSLRLDSPSAGALANAPKEQVPGRWLDMQSFDGRPLMPTLSGLGLEYRVVQLFSRDPGRQQGVLRFNVGQLRAPGGAGRSLVREWRFESGTDGWTAANQCTLATAGGVLEVTSTGNDPYLMAAVTAPGGTMVLRFRLRSEAPGGGQVFWQTRDIPRPQGDRMRLFRVEGGGTWQDVAVTFPVRGELTGLRLDPGSAPGKIEVDGITLSYQDEPGPVTADLPVAFEVEPSHPVTFRVLDENRKPATAAFEIRDQRGRVYPAQSKRLAPDFFFQPQVYRSHGETVRLPAGAYTVRCSRGPESVPETRTLLVGAAAQRAAASFTYQVKRWIDPAKLGWWSGDHHIHAAGCAHYTNPTEGVHAADMARHIMGEDLKVGANLTWGPCFDYQKQFFTGRVDAVSRYPYLLRYDIEVSGFGSHQSGHLCLLRLKDQMYPGGASKDHWPTLGLNTLRWAKRQGAVTGPAHSAAGLGGSVGRVGEGPDGPGGLPSYDVPRYDGIGANEFVVDITHEVPGPAGKPVPAVDFISTMNTDRRAELTMWYHSLNSGFRVRASGETDFPCVSGERVGMGRVYVKQRGKLTYDDWCEGIREGRSYVSDGSHHLMELRARVPETKQSVAVGDKGSELRLRGPGLVRFSVLAAARRSPAAELPVELVVNGYPVERRMLSADGVSRPLEFETRIERSSWAAVRIFPGAHTNPIFVLVDGKPVRGSRRSAEWCLRGVDQCWSQKERTYRAEEKEEARRAYDHAREVYRRIMAESAP